MDLVVENMLYIESKNVEKVYYGEGEVYVAPSVPVPYAHLFGNIATTYDNFYSYAMSFQKSPSETELLSVSLYLELRARNATPEGYIRGFREVQRLVKEGIPCKARTRAGRYEKKKRSMSIHEGEAEKLFLEGSMYMSIFPRSSFYRTPYSIAEYYAEKGATMLAQRLAKEALSVAGRTSSPGGVDQCHMLLQAVKTSSAPNALEDLLFIAAERVEPE